MALVSAAIFTSRVGHVIAIYWICVTTQSMPLAFFLLSLILYIHYLENGRLAVLIASYLSFALCAFSNINGPTLVALITLYDMLVRRDRSVRSILKNESGFYLIVAAFLYLQFGVFGYNPPQDYRVSIGLLALRNFGILNLFAYNSLYVASYLAGAPPAMLAAGVLAGVTTMWVAISAFLRGVRNGLRQEGRLYLFFGFWYVWGFLPYLPLSEHVWPQYITASAVGLSFLSAALLTRFLKPKMLAASLCVILAVSFFSVRLFEREEFETRGIIYKSALARNVVSDLKQAIEQRPEAETIIVLDGKVELWWILHYGRNAEVFTGKNRPIFYMRTGQEIPAGPKSLVLRFDNMRLHRVQ
ncbi:MAG: hypothetical protein HY801_12550 [Candidatus Lindowbacteria bacterium]|nr:hypothetical protein [Candidatus Lindowbacteria bacterium]